MERAPFSRCALWRDQKSFYGREGIEAWNGQVPFYITSNPYLAHAYSTLVLRFLQDLRQRGGAGPAVVLELGAGHGAFSFQILRCLAELRESCPMLAADLVYVMTDVAEKNVAFWRTHPALAPFVADGLLDFAFFDVEAPAELELLVSGRSLPLAGRPLAVIANYVFDSVAADLFVTRDGQLREVLVPPAMTLLPALDTAPFWDESQETGLADPRYGSPLDAVLRERAGTLEGRFFFPSATLRCLSRLSEMAGREMLLLVADKGNVDAGRLPEARRLALGVHGGCVSTSLDFRALESFALGQRGDAYLCPTGGILIAAFAFGARFEELPETRLTLAQLLGVFSPGHLYDVAKHFGQTKRAARLEGIVALLELTLWDPVVFADFLPVIVAALPEAAPPVVERLAGSLERITANFYFLPGTLDTFFQVGLVFQELGRHEAALGAYEESLAWFGETGGTRYNMGLCRYQLGRSDEALESFRESLRLAPESIEALGWIAQIEHEREA